MIEKKLNESGVKAYQRSDLENRVKPYFDFHRTLDRSLTAQDVDNVEYSIRYDTEGNMVVCPRAVIELTRYDVNDLYKEPTPAYLEAILKRFQRDAQGNFICAIAKLLNVDAYIVLFKTDCSMFWVYNLSKKGLWETQNAEGHELFLKRLRDGS